MELSLKQQTSKVFEITQEYDTSKIETFCNQLNSNLAFSKILDGSNVFFNPNNQNNYCTKNYIKVESTENGIEITPETNSHVQTLLELKQVLAYAVKKGFDQLNRNTFRNIENIVLTNEDLRFYDNSIILALLTNF